MSRALRQTFYACAGLVGAVVIAGVARGPITDPPQEHAQARQESPSPWAQAESLCWAMQSSPEYRASSAGGDYRHSVDEKCDEFRRTAARGQEPDFFAGTPFGAYLDELRAKKKPVRQRQDRRL